MAKLRTFHKILAANRGEIAIRIFRACTELGIGTVAVYSEADKLSIHRYKADTAFRVGTATDPVGAYLDQEAILAVARREGVDAIHPGYGFLSENAEFARRCAAEGFVFIGPSPDALEIFGDKTAARRLAVEAGVPVVPGTESAISDVAEVRAFAAEHGFPILLKAAFGGGGRGMRIVRDESEIDEAFERASGEAQKAFGRGDLFCERLIERPRHVEVQILADVYGSVVHLFERDCSVQRRHQKVVEIAPALSLGEAVREELYQAALRIMARAGYVNAGTVEFLIDPGGDWYFIEVNPRIQVEHTVTECITGRDLVQAQIRVAEGHALSDPEVSIPSQAAITRSGYAIQCRVTTEDPAHDFLPDTGKIRVYRSAAGYGIRLDASTGGAGTLITGDYDSLLVKVTAFARTFREAAAKAQRSLREFRVRGVKTNIPFLDNVVGHPRFLAGDIDTTFVDTTPELYEFPVRRDRATKLLRTIANAVVNGPPGITGPVERPRAIHLLEPPTGVVTPPARTAMSVFRAEGAAGLSRWLVDNDTLQVTDTTFRDAHQSLLATRVRTADLARIAPATAALAPGLFSVEMWGGATFDVAYRFLKEDPWQRLATLRELMPDLLLQMLFRGANAVGYTNYPDNVVRRFVRRAADAGMDVFRIFDALNWVPNMAIAMEEVGNAGKIVEACLCYTGDVSDPARGQKYDLDYYLRLAADLKAHGAHILAIKDMAGLLKPAAAKLLVEALRSETGLPVHLHTHDTSGNGVATCLAAAQAGVDIVDCALSSMSGLTSQPSLNALLAALGGDPRRPELDSASLDALAVYWEGVRELYAPFESGLKSSTAEVYWHEIPGGQYSNLRPRAIQLGLGERWGEIKRRYREVNLALGDIIKVTPTSKVVADFAMFLVQNDLTVEDAMAKADRLDFPQSVVDFLAGRLGQPYQGFPPAIQRAVLGPDLEPLTGRVGDDLAPFDFEAEAERLGARLGRPPSEAELLSSALYPAVFAEYLEHTDRFGDVSTLPTEAFLYGPEVGEEIAVDIEPGKTLIVRLLAIGEVDDEGRRRVFFDLNGQPREIAVRDLSVEAAVDERPRADPSDDRQVGASMPGTVFKVLVEPGDTVTAGQTLLVLEAMKMETAVRAAVAGTVERVLVSVGDKAKAGDLLAILAS